MPRVVKLDESHVGPGVTVRAEPLVCEVDERELEKDAGEAIAAALRKGVRSIGERAKEGGHRLFNVSGRLANGITSQGGEVVAPADRLQDPEVLGRFLDVMPDPYESREVIEALDRADDRVAGIAKGRRS